MLGWLERFFFFVFFFFPLFVGARPLQCKEVRNDLVLADMGLSYDGSQGADPTRGVRCPVHSGTAAVKRSVPYSAQVLVLYDLKLAGFGGG